jgi:hypothetical protein
MTSPPFLPKLRPSPPAPRRCREALGVSRSTRRWAKAGVGPRPVRLTDGTLRMGGTYTGGGWSGPAAYIRHHQDGADDGPFLACPFAPIANQ